MGRVDYRVVANNPAGASENRIHADDVARRYGFRGGLVPGVTVYGYATHVALEALGPAWVESGSAAVRFNSPCYDGDDVVVRAEPSGPGAVDLEVLVGQNTCVTGWARLSGEAGDVAGPLIPAADAPAAGERPPAGEAVLVPGRVLGSIALPTDDATTTAYLARLGEPSPTYAERGWVHPGQMLEGANWVLMANVVMPAWLHVESEVHHRRAVKVGEAVEVRARIADAYEKSGHHFVSLDTEWVAGAEAVAAARHTAIWQLR